MNEHFRRFSEGVLVLIKSCAQKQTDDFVPAGAYFIPGNGRPWIKLELPLYLLEVIEGLKVANDNFENRVRKK